MIIEKSPFYKQKVLPNTIETLSRNNKESSDIENLQNNPEKFSFWNWFKGLVNPLQNLPIISGIYSSVKSEDDSSDRDMVQNSLGGFLYGGPIGAIAGFGNWVFNKLFDKTPTELALDLSGISNIWKNEKNENVDNALVAKTQNDISPLLLSRREENSIIKSKNDVAYARKNETNNIIVDSDKLNSRLSQEPMIGISSSKNISNKDIINLSETNLGTTQKSMKNVSLKNDSIISIKKSTPKIQETVSDITTSNYKKIDFNYPTWKPEDNDMFDNKELIQSKSRKLYKETESLIKQNINVDA